MLSMKQRKAYDRTKTGCMDENWITGPALLVAQIDLMYMTRFPKSGRSVLFEFRSWHSALMVLEIGKKTFSLYLIAMKRCVCPASPSSMELYCM